MSSDTPRSRLERALITAALRRFHSWRRVNSKEFVAKILSGDDSTVNGGKLGGDMIRACNALANARRK